MRNVLLFCVVFSIGAAQGFGGGFSSIKLGGGAKAGALGMAYTALSDDASGGYWNPAGLAFLGKKDFLLSVHRWIESVRGEFLGFGWGGERSGMGFHVLYTEVGGIERRIVPSPTPLFTFSAHELIVGLSYGRVIWERFSVGMTLKALYEKIFIEETWGVGGDVGVLWSVWEGGLRIGSVLQNVGKTGPLRSEDVELPLTGRLGVALPVEILSGRWMFTIDGVKEGGFPYHIHGGMEYEWRNILFLRCGYQNGYETRDWTGGVGVVWRGYRLDYCYMPLREGLGDSHRLTFGIGW